MNRRLILSAFLVLCLSTGLLAQGKLRVYAAAFYNLENLWDTEDNPDNPGDDDFTPGGKYEWTQVKYEQKLQNVAKVISQLARDYCPAGPAIIGISEVENKKVLEDLVKTEPIASLGYRIVHVEREITERLDCCFARAKTVSRLNMPCVIFRSLSESLIMN